MRIVMESNRRAGSEFIVTTPRSVRHPQRGTGPETADRPRADAADPEGRNQGVLPRLDQRTEIGWIT